METILHRIQQIAINEDITIGAFERVIGASKGVLSRAIANGTDIQSKWIQIIVENYPQYSSDWLLSGKGEMLRTDNTSIIHSSPILLAEQPIGIPYYDVDFCAGFNLVCNDQSVQPSGYINIPQYAEAQLLVNVTGHSMEPLISHGDIIAVRKVENWHNFVLYGEIYGVVTERFRTIKKIRKSNNRDMYMLEPLNKTDYDTTEIAIKEIISIWEVIGCIKQFV